MQTSSFNQTRVLVASNSISLSCLEGRIYIITLLNPLPVLIISLLNPLPGLFALKILREILSFTRSFMINTHPLAGCLETSERKVKQFRVIPRIASSGLVHCLSIHWPNLNYWMRLVLQRDSRFVSRNCHAIEILRSLSVRSYSCKDSRGPPLNLYYDISIAEDLHCLKAVDRNFVRNGGTTRTHSSLCSWAGVS